MFLNDRTPAVAEAKRQVLGLKLIDRFVRFVDLHPLDNGYQLLNYGEGELFQPVTMDILMDEGERYKVADAIASVLETTGVETRQVVTAIDSQLAIVRRVPLEEGLMEEELSDYMPVSYTHLTLPTKA